MKRIIFLPAVILVIVAFMDACNSNAWDELPSPIAAFVSQYFPFGEVQSYTDVPGGSVVQIRNGATLAFDNDYDWIDINGNGQVLPQNFLYDKLAPVLYDYIESIEHVNDVYRVSRSGENVKVEFLDSHIDYDIVTHKIFYPDGEQN